MNECVDDLILREWATDPSFFPAMTKNSSLIHFLSRLDPPGVESQSLDDRVQTLQSALEKRSCPR